MTLLPNVPFVDGDLWTPELANLAFNSPVFDGATSYLGHRSKLLTTEIEDAFVNRVVALEDAFKVSTGTGLSVSVNGGVFYTPSSVRTVIAPQTISVPDNTTSYVWLDQNATLKATTVIDTYATVLAKVTAVSGAVTAIEPWHRVEYKRQVPPSRLIKVFGGSSTTDIVCTNGQVLAPVVVCRSFTVPSGVSVSFNNYCKILCQDFTVDGTINGTSTIKGGEGFADTASGASGSVSGRNGFGIGGGQPYAGGSSYQFLMQPYGSGGASGNWSTTASSSGTSYDLGDGGTGGAGLYVEASRDITVNGSVICKGGDGQTTTTSDSNKLVSAGSGGGSGGTIVYVALGKVRFGSLAVHDIRGGNGGDGVGNFGGTIYGAGGGNGAGGQMWIFSTDANPGTSSILLTPGVKGTSSPTMPLGYAGAGGGGNGGVGGGSAVGGTDATAGTFTIVTEVPIGL